MASVESLGIQTIDVAHDPGEITFRCPQAQMIMIPHQRIGKHFDTPQPMGFAQGVEKGLIVGIVVKWCLADTILYSYLLEFNH